MTRIIFRPPRYYQRTFHRHHLLFVLGCAAACLGLVVAASLRIGVPNAFAAEIPTTGRPSGDLGRVLDHVGHWQDGRGYYAKENPFPPVTLFLFWPASRIGVRAAAALAAALTLVILATVLAALARRAGGGARVRATAVFLLITGLVSYGLRFEFERGQWNVIAVGLAWIGARLASGRRTRGAACAGVVLLTLGTQLKIYPAVFGVLLLLPLRDWRSRLPIVVWVAAINLACFLALGMTGLRGFLFWQRTQVATMEVSVFNGSTASFAGLVVSHLGLGLPPLVIVLALLLAAFALAVHVVRRADEPGSPAVLAALTVVALLVPPVSYDYKLSLLPWIGAGLLLVRTVDRPGGRLAALVAGACYGSLLLGPSFRPGMGSSVPQLLVLLGCCAWLAPDARACIRD